MEQLLLHLFGDYILQTGWMAKWKVRNTWIAAIHALTYTLPFMILTTNWISLAIIYSTHLWIDRFSLATYLLKWKKNLPNDVYVYEDGFKYPIYTGNMFLVYVVTDNTIHLLINYFALLI